MGAYVARRLLNYAILLFVAISLTYLLAATQLNPRALYEVRNPPLDPVIVEQTLRAKNLSDQVPLLQRYWTWLTDIVLHWDWGESPTGGSVNDEVSRRIWVSLRLITIGSLVGIVGRRGDRRLDRHPAVQAVRPVLHGHLAVPALGAVVRHRERPAGVGDRHQQRVRIADLRVRRRDRGDRGLSRCVAGGPACSTCCCPPSC